jgi:hypothetical protein
LVSRPNIMISNAMAEAAVMATTTTQEVVPKVVSEFRFENLIITKD